MKNTVLALSAAILMGFATTATAADQVSNDTLASMGLGGMQQMSDDAGMNVRGKGFASIFGIGYSKFFSNTQLTGYNGVSGPKPNAFTIGGNASVTLGGGLLPFLGGGFLGTGSFGASAAFAR